MNYQHYLPPEGDQLMHIYLLFLEREQTRLVNNMALEKNNPETLEMRAKVLENIIKPYKSEFDRVGLNKWELSSLTFMRHELRRIKALQKPSFLNRLRYNREVNGFANYIRGRFRGVNFGEIITSDFEKEVATNVNVANLKEEVKGLGFKGFLDEPLTKMVDHKMPEFPLAYYDVTRSDTDYILHFKNKPGTDAYYLEKYEAFNRQDRQKAIKDYQPPAPVTVYLSDKFVLSADEARTVAAGQPLSKKIDDQNYFLVPDGRFGVKSVQFDVEKALDSYPIAEMQPNKIRGSLISDIAKGKVRAVTVTLADGKTEILNLVMRYDDGAKNYTLQFRTKEGLDVDPKTIGKEISQAQKVYQRIMAARTQKGKQKGLGRSSLGF